MALFELGREKRGANTPLDEAEAVELEHPLGSASDRVEVKLVDLWSAEGSVLVEPDENPVVLGMERPSKF